jgi:broad specificity phosphatase PhoE
MGNNETKSDRALASSSLADIAFKMYLVRHGQTKLNAEGKINGEIDEPLNEQGVLDALQVYKNLPDGFQGSTIFHSPLLRAKQTALLIKSQLSYMNLVEIKDLEERKFGRLAGLSWDEAVKLSGDPRLKIKDRNAEFDYYRFGGESHKQFKDRVWSAISRVRSTGIQGFPLIVTHGGVIRLLRSKFSHIALHEEDLTIQNGGLFEISFPMF